MVSAKKKLTLTIDSGLIESAKKLVESRDVSLSGVVEEFLRALVNEVDTEEDWLATFHKNCFPKDYTEPSDSEIEKTRKTISK